MPESEDIPPGFEDLRGQVFDQRYEVAELVDTGPRHIVFAGTRLEDDRAVVLRMIRPAAPHDSVTVTRFERRLRACGQIRHPVVSSPLDSGELFDGTLYIVSERPPGETLTRALAGRSSGRLSWADARPLLLDLVRGLAAMHARTVIHGGVSPACCWITPGSPRPSLRLLGLGANIGPSMDDQEVGASRTTAVGGDAIFIAPEAAGGLLGTEQSDVYLVGLSAYTMLTGRPPFFGANLFKVVSMHLVAPVPAMKEAGAEVPAAVEAMIGHWLAKEADQRPPTMVELERAILGLDEQGQTRAVQPDEFEKAKGPQGRGRAGRANASTQRRRTSRLHPVAQLPASPRTITNGPERRLPRQEVIDPGPMSSVRGQPAMEPRPAPRFVPPPLRAPALVPGPVQAPAPIQPHAPAPIQPHAPAPIQPHAPAPQAPQAPTPVQPPGISAPPRPSSPNMLFGVIDTRHTDQRAFIDAAESGGAPPIATVGSEAAAHPSREAMNHDSVPVDGTMVLHSSAFTGVDAAESTVALSALEGLPQPLGDPQESTLLLTGNPVSLLKELVDRQEGNPSASARVPTGSMDTPSIAHAAAMTPQQHDAAQYREIPPALERATKSRVGLVIALAAVWVAIVGISALLLLLRG